MTVTLNEGQAANCYFERFHQTIGAPGEIVVTKQTTTPTAEEYEIHLDGP